MRGAGTPQCVDGGGILASLKERQAEIQVRVRERRIQRPNGFEFPSSVRKTPVTIGKQPTVIVLACAVIRGGAHERERQKENGAGNSAGECQILKYQLQRQLDLARRPHAGHAAERR